MMMKYILIGAALVTLAACEDNREKVSSDSARSYRVECIGGVEYYFLNVNSRAALAPRVDSETLTFVRCNDVIKAKK